MKCSTIQWMVKKCCNVYSSRLQCKLLGINFPNPVGLAAGFDKNGDLFNSFQHLGFGFIESGTSTPLPQDGNPKPRIFRYARQNALINRMGFNNQGSQKFIENLKASMRTIPLGINVGKNKITPDEKTAEDYATMIQKASSIADYITINISSPNTPNLRSFQAAESLDRLLKDIDRLSAGSARIKPVFVKLSPDMESEDFTDTLKVIASSWVSGIILTNTTLDKQSIQNPEEGGLSGVPLRIRATEKIKIAYRLLNGKMPIIGVGGIDSGEAALEKIQAGASLVQIYTGLIYEGPFLAKKINRYLDDYMKKNKIQHISELVGISA